MNTLLLAGLTILLLPVAGILLVRSISALMKPALLPCHSYIPTEPGAAELEAMAWPDWIRHEEQLFANLQARGLQRPRPAAITQDWNRSSSFTPDHPPEYPIGAVVLLHGLTDSPYSLRHLGQAAAAAGFAVVAIRLPGHGTVPAGLKTIHRSAWAAATRLAMREAARLVGPERPISIIGYSNGAALALSHAFDALEDPALRQPARLILISPMIGLTIFARFAGIAAWPALLPGLGRAAWLDILPETNPFKYRSFPVNAAVQSERLTQDLQRRINRSAKAATLDDLPPILAFQSVVDSTVSAAAVVDRCFSRLPALSSGQSHELVLFDVNRASATEPLQRESANAALAKLTDDGPYAYRTTILTNAADEDPATIIQTFAPGDSSPSITPLGIPYPPNIISLSHIALPFPPDDPLYGLAQTPAPILGETDILTQRLDQFTRLTSNPFYSWLADRVLNALPKEPPA